MSINQFKELIMNKKILFGIGGAGVLIVAGGIVMAVRAIKDMKVAKESDMTLQQYRLCKKLEKKADKESKKTEKTGSQNISAITA
jgi:hypothetical protein